MSNTRTDVHRPSAIIPSDYEEVAVWTMNIQGIGDCQFILREREIARAHMARTKGTYAHVETSGSCQICGNVQAIYLVLFYHAKTNTYIRVGMDCTMKVGMSADQGRMNLFKKNVADAREAQAGKKKAQALLSDAGLTRAWEIAQENVAARAAEQQAFEAGNCEPRKWSLPYEERTIEDIVGKLVKYGSVSPKQTEYLRTLLGKIGNRAAVEAAKQAENEAAAPCPSGRIKITGTVVSLKTEDNRFSRSSYDEFVTRMLVVSDEGFKVWGSRTGNFEKGERVSFVATVTPSDKDPKFGFFKRPSKAQHLDAAGNPIPELVYNSETVAPEPPKGQPDNANPDHTDPVSF
jgi:hypothetical protein